ncbi:MAG: TIR domain-containing protein [Anaerolineae bacterium]|nr:TIR domain-containing protein [Anaerolineae bacterium]
MKAEPDSAEREQLHEAFFQLQTESDLADLLNVDRRSLFFYLYHLSSENKYKSFDIPKRSGGTRHILTPTRGLKQIQRRLLSVLHCVYEPKQSTHGFVLEKSIVTNAMRHLGQRYVCNVDIQDFFPSINFGRVRGMFGAYPYYLNEHVATLLAQLCCHENQLPQGAPTSPIISNMICARMDSELQQLAKRHYCIYTRYADDITFSTRRSEFPSAIAQYVDSSVRVEAGEELLEVIEGNGFTLQPTKGRLLSRKHRQEVTGLIVNKRLNTRRKFIRQIRGMLHAWEKYGLEAAQAEFEKRYNQQVSNSVGVRRFEVVLKGKLNFLKMVRGADDLLYLKYADWYQRLKYPESYGERVAPAIQAKTETNARVFISYSRKQSKFALKLVAFLSNNGIPFWIDTADIVAGRNWTTTIHQGLQECTLMLVVVTPDSMNSVNVQDEWQFFRDENRPIIPLLLEPAELNYRLRGIHYIPFYQEDHEQAFTRLLQHLRNRYGL